jgi:ribonuclease Z
MDLDVVFLGTSGSVPSPLRGPSATLVRRGGDRILIDCGEGTQRQLLRSSAGLVDLELLLFTHYHADHILGLPGLLKTFALRAREAELRVYGPPGLTAVFRAFDPFVGRLPFPLRLNEISPGEAIERDGYRLEAHRAAHRAPANAWALVEEVRPGRFDVEQARALGVPEGPLFGALQRGEPVTTPAGETVQPGQVLGEARAGRRLVFSGDTRPCRGVLTAAQGADLLVHESSFTSEDAERAEETKHSTAREAALVAKAAEVRLLALTHLGQRARVSDVKREAREHFEDTVVPRDFDIIDIPLPERGAPALLRGAAVGWAAARDLEPTPADGRNDEPEEDTA